MIRENDLIGYLSQAYQQDDALWQLLGSMPVSKTLRPGQMVFKDSHQPEALFVHQGILKGLYYDDKGREHVTRFWKERQVILLTGAQQPNIATADHLQALEPSSLSAINYASATALKLAPGQVARFAAKILLTDRNMAELKSHLCALPAREAYKKFKKFLPEDRVHLRDIASFLGITPQTISEIRKSTK
ncbi:hypothetical protein LZD49_34535 [Dyadobacter sp. CY261]|uniref:Crp/Fnr family transcriptional regulator n=1 Tax=Dyadobacter sp. CY261 TaxID=2907203 RepID=UPI001F204916|nr:hypothetical protein [Dyadobacter sp. CY261]MCF0075641.1 hypothetical protein [Dyadobacter sp. CY261]